MNLGNKYARSYSSKNPPPRPSDVAEAEAMRAAAPSFMDELGMDKETTRERRRRRNFRRLRKLWMLVVRRLAATPRRCASSCPITR